ncbi:MAG: hypothetical protein FWE71_08075 [Nocardioidaceae bacterium]|nr:hypothetical protein [Nocardioidaceae bacterium]MCL2613161.1 hypothetical protein [Nocardioidaceae bacterium]
MRGLTVRWALTGAGDGVEQRLRDYVADSSHARFEGLEGLSYKTWRMSPGEWFEGSYVFADEAAREAFQTTFTAGAAESPVSGVVGSPPVLIEPCEVVGIAQGASGFASAPRAE